MNYKLACRKGRCVQVMYNDDGKWISTGCKTKEEAELYVLRKLHQNTDITFGEFAKDFYSMSKDDELYQIDVLKGRDRLPRTYHNCRSILVNYIMPRFQNDYLRDIRPIDIDDWFIRVTSKTGREIAGSRKNSILSVLREVLNLAVRDCLIDTNPVAPVKNAKNRRVRKNVPLTKEEVKKLFPDDDIDLLGVWGNVQLACYFLIAYETGFRPCEILSIRKSDIDFNTGVVYTNKSVVQNGVIENRIKTTGKGKDYKIGTLSNRTLNLIGKIKGEYLFKVNDVFITHYKTMVVFKDACAKELGRTNLSRYSLRHYFMTSLIGKLPKEVIMELMGHTVWEETYDDSTKEMIAERLLENLGKYGGIKR